MHKFAGVGNSWGEETNESEASGWFAQVALTRSCFDAFEEYFLVSVQVVKFIRLTHFALMFQFYTHSEHHTYSIEVFRG